MKFTEVLTDLIERKVKVTLSNNLELEYLITDFDTDFQVITLEALGTDPLTQCYFSMSAVVGLVKSENFAHISILNEDVIKRAVKDALKV